MTVTTQGRKLPQRSCLVILAAVLIFLAQILSANSSPEPEPSPTPDAKPEPNPQFMNQPVGGRPLPYQPVPSRPGDFRPQSPCEMTQQCCGMADQQCCAPGGKKCYYVYEMQCSSSTSQAVGDDKPECNVQVVDHCKSIKVKECRLVSEVIYRDLQASVCVQKPMQRCFKYERKVCTPASRPVPITVTWENDRLNKVDQEAQHCSDVRTYNCNDLVYQDVVKKNVRKPKKSTQTRRECKNVPKVEPGRQVVVPSPRISYQNQCMEVQVPVCSTSPCGYGPQESNAGYGPQTYCNSNQMACSVDQYSTNTVCPTPAGYPSIASGYAGSVSGYSGGASGYPRGTAGYPAGGATIYQSGSVARSGRRPVKRQAVLNDGLSVWDGKEDAVATGRGEGSSGAETSSRIMNPSWRPQYYNPQQNCEQVSMPVCNNDLGGPCQAGAQQCCSQETRKVCRQVPVRVVENVTMTLPGRVVYNRECQDVQFEAVSYYDEVVEQVVNRTSKKCEPVDKYMCVNYTIPTYYPSKETKNDTVMIQVPSCQPRVEEDTYCHTFPAGEVECRNQTVKRAFKLNKVRCDKEVDRPICIQIPKAECRLPPKAPPTSNVNCSPVPRRVCVDTCNPSPFCNSCQNFANEGGFGTCPSSTCPNFYPGQAQFNESYFGSELPGAGVTGGGYVLGGDVGSGGEFFPNLPMGSGGEYFPGSDGSFFSGQTAPGSAGTYFPGAPFQPGGSDGGYFPGQTTGSGGSYFPGMMPTGSDGGYLPGQTTGSGGSYFPGMMPTGSDGGYYPGSYSTSAVPSTGSGGSYYNPSDTMGGSNYYFNQPGAYQEPDLVSGSRDPYQPPYGFERLSKPENSQMQKKISGSPAETKMLAGEDSATSNKMATSKDTDEQNADDLEDEFADL